MVLVAGMSSTAFAAPVCPDGEVSSGNICIPCDVTLDVSGSIHCDVDGDGVPDELDECRDTPPATAVDEVGCPLVTVAGELISLNTTALFISSLTSTMIWMAPTILGIAGVGVYIKSKKN